MRIAMFALSLSASLAVSLAVFADHPPNTDPRKAVAMDGLGPIRHPVSTKNAEAQKFFDQGLAFVYAFNHDEAVRSFRLAAELDPDLAMAHWGIGLALGPNYNVDADSEAGKAAYAASRRARALAENAPEQEQAYIQALTKRYSTDSKADKKKLGRDYADAMKELVKRFPDDLDAATLYAESLMNLQPWELWTADGKPAEDTPEILATLESVLRRNPDHTGANHYYVHAVEASPYPERGLPSANRLGALAPQAGHLVHMPSHIYLRIGDYAMAAAINAQAEAVDRAYIERFKVGGIYALMYFSHNMHFQAVAHANQGRYADAKAAADRLAAHVGPFVKDVPMLEGFLPTPTLVLARFHRWDEILALPEPDAKLAIHSALGHFARGLAFAATGKIEDAGKERDAFRKLRDGLPAEAMYGMRNRAADVLAVASGMLDAQIALLGKDQAGAIKLLRDAAQAEDALKYMEPKDWYIPVRETLGRLLLAGGDAAAGEQVFREDLGRNPRSGRSLLGLRESLKKQGKDYAAKQVDALFDAAWKNAEPKALTLDDL
ncbi:MAG: hypothetical protein ACJ8F7_17285 [Gemmataceae bacterium]